jgi:hypothetical protein
MGDVEENKAVIRRFVEEVQNNKNWDVLDELNAEDFVNHSARRSGCRTTAKAGSSTWPHSWAPSPTAASRSTT